MNTYTEFWPWWDPEEQTVTKRDLMRLLTAALATITVEPMLARALNSPKESSEGTYVGQARVLGRDRLPDFAKASPRLASWTVNLPRQGGRQSFSDGGSPVRGRAEARPYRVNRQQRIS